ncbi:ATP-binding cassette domain-containing protein [Desulfogranum japonicum]|uniref:ATP-binding cassette domain-containing protein n=1 Tax=Desulfogranum japonicum TaxID=231447 RepID=UPI0003F9D33A|nr:ABC transporter ATP-binding protein [Desulfogranum japonicum]
MNIYHLEHIRQQFRGRVVLDIEQLDIEQGKIYALLGPNGAGKTTLLDILGFLNHPSHGRLYYQGRMVDRRSKNEILTLRRQVVCVDQHPIMFSTSVYKNIEFGLKIRKYPSPERKRIIDEVLALVSLERYRQAPAHRLSGGETQRLALARALALKPQVLLCDEPTASVDSENKTVITGLLKHINEELGTTILATTHDRLQAASLADHTIVLENGKLAATIYENCFSCKVVASQDQSISAIMQANLSLPLVATHAALTGKRGRLCIDPFAVRINQQGHSGQKALILDSTVVLLMQDDEFIRVIVDIGVQIVVLVPVEEYAAINLQIGERVQVTIPPRAITIFPID